MCNSGMWVARAGKTEYVDAAYAAACAGSRGLGRRRSREEGFGSEAELARSSGVAAKL